MYFSGPRAASPGDIGLPALVQHGNTGLVALGTFLYRRQPTLCTFLDQGRPALSTKMYPGQAAPGTWGMDIFVCILVAGKLSKAQPPARLRGV